MPACQCSLMALLLLSFLTLSHALVSTISQLMHLKFLQQTCTDLSNIWNTRLPPACAVQGPSFHAPSMPASTHRQACIHPQDPSHSQISALQETSPVREGETALITAGAGATGSFGVQVARLAGAHVIATCSSADKARVLQDLGAHRIINYHEEVQLLHML